MIEINHIYQGDCIKVMRRWPDRFVQTVVTSPPYWGLRDYGVAGQIGLEPTPEKFVEKMGLSKLQIYNLKKQLIRRLKNSPYIANLVTTMRSKIIKEEIL